MKKINFIDLFAGCGGLSEGFYRQGFNALAHVEINPSACETLINRMRYYGYEKPEKYVLNEDVTNASILDKIDKCLNEREVDIIIGGPPCQAYSSLGRARDEDGMQTDPRNFLFENYAKILNHYKPKIFVFENVTGMLNSKIAGKKIIDLIFKSLSHNYKITFDPNEIVLNSVHYGVPQVRKRVIIIGVRKDLSITPKEIYDEITKTHYDPEMDEKDRGELQRYVTVKDAIEELPALLQGEGIKEMHFVSTKSNEFLKKISNDQDILFDHICRRHNDKDVARYVEMSKNGWNFKELLENKPELSHDNKRLFGNSYVVQWWASPSKTIIAHLYKDGNQFIHPDYRQGRTLTIREAARLQSFSDDFTFTGSKTEQYKQIGNAVPPFFAEAIAKAIKKKIREME